jgi:hypothetical protein
VNIYLSLSLCYILAVAVVAAQPAVPVVARIQEKVLSEISRLPSYTCTETIERFHRPAKAERLTRQDRVRLEVAVVNGYEMYGWPGDRNLGQRDVTRMVPGFIGSGDFTMHIREAFTQPAGVFKFVGEEQREGQPALRYEFEVPLKGSGWRVRANTQEVLPVGYHGSFWVDRKSLDLIEVSFFADEVPRVLGFSDFTKVIKYTRSRIGSSDFLLPSLVRMATADLNGDERVNEARFQDCRQYAVESVVRFGDASAEIAVPTSGNRSPVPAVSLPDDFEVTAVLESAFDSEDAAIGDPIRLRVQRAIRVGRMTVVPKNALLVGRIVRLDAFDKRRYLDFILTHVEFDGHRVDISRRQNQVQLAIRTPTMKFHSLVSCPG